LLAGVTGTGHAGEEFGLELLALPLIHEGRTGARVLGALAPGGIPVWIGTSAIGNLTLGTFRYVGPAAPNVFRPSAPARTSGRPRRGLVVYDGGLTTDEIGSPSTG
jgi:hypothetical protein